MKTPLRRREGRLRSARPEPGKPRGGRRKVPREQLPRPGERRHVAWLPRDIGLGGRHAPAGTLLCGWDWGTETHQLWQVVGADRDGAIAAFVGFVCDRWDDRQPVPR